MDSKRKVEIFTANCPLCRETIEKVRKLACDSCEIALLDMNEEAVKARALGLGVRSVPAIAVDGKLAECCANTGIDESTLKGMGVGTP